MGLYSIIPGFCGAPWAVGAPIIVTTFHPTSNGPGWRDRLYHIPLQKDCNFCRKDSGALTLHWGVEHTTVLGGGGGPVEMKHVAKPDGSDKPPWQAGQH